MGPQCSSGLGVGCDARLRLPHLCPRSVPLWHGRRRQVPDCRDRAQQLRRGRCRSVKPVAASTTATLNKALPPSLPKEWEAAYEQLSMERGYCTLSTGAERYTPANLAERALAPPNARVNIVKRGVEMTYKIGSFFSALLWDKVTGQTNDRTRVRLRAAQLRNVLTDLGPSFIKMGQVLASRPDIVREDYMDELCVLQDDVPSFPDPLAFAIMEEELGRPLGAVFSSISERPIAAASLGQVLTQ